MKKSARPRSALLCRLGHLFAANLNVLRNALQTLAGGFRPGGYFLDVSEGFGIVHFLAKFFEKGMNLGENEKHFAAATRLQKEFLVERAVQHERRNHIPIAPDLAKPGVFLAGKRSRNLYEVIGALRPELGPKPASCLAHLRFAAEVVEF